MPTIEKEQQITDLTERMSASKSLYLADFTGVDVASVTLLRSRLRAASIDYRVVKNRLAKRAASEAGLGSLAPFLVGPTAVAFGGSDPVEPAKILQKFIDDGGKLTIKAGLVDGELLTSEQVKQLATLPSREELIAKLLGSVQSPLYGLVGALSGLLRNLVGVLAALEKKRTEEGGAPAAEA
ncbi:MAG: 50S ribosomal protein L10 [Gemmatimonadota bacterium]